MILSDVCEEWYAKVVSCYSVEQFPGLTVKTVDKEQIAYARSLNKQAFVGMERDILRKKQKRKKKKVELQEMFPLIFL